MRTLLDDCGRNAGCILPENDGIVVRQPARISGFLKWGIRKNIQESSFLGKSRGEVGSQFWEHPGGGFTPKIRRTMELGAKLSGECTLREQHLHAGFYIVRLLEGNQETPGFYSSIIDRDFDQENFWWNNMTKIDQRTTRGVLPSCTSEESNNLGSFLALTILLSWGPPQIEQSDNPLLTMGRCDLTMALVGRRRGSALRLLEQATRERELSWAMLGLGARRFGKEKTTWKIWKLQDSLFLVSGLIQKLSKPWIVFFLQDSERIEGLARVACTSAFSEKQFLNVRGVPSTEYGMT